MQPYQPLQLLHVLTHMAWARLTRPQFPEYRTNDPAFYPVCYPTFKRMREEKKIFYVTRFLGWVVGGDYDTLVTLLRDDRLTVRFQDWKFYPRKEESKKNELNRLTDNLLMAKHRPDHQRLRKLAVPAFSPRIVDKLMPKIKATIARHFDALEAQGGSVIDIVQVARSIPIEVLTQYLGVSDTYQNDFHEVSHAILGQFSPNTVIDMDAANKGIQMLKNLVREKRANPQDDLVSVLATTADADDRLSEDEMLSLIASVLAAGPDSTRDHITCVAYALARQPQAWAEVRANRDLMHNATRESFRWDAWGHRGYTRFALEDMEIHGQKIAKGEMVRLAFPVFLYDEKVFPEPDTFNLHRDNLDKVIYFGIGPHYCVGANIARGVSEAVIQEMLDRYETISVASPPVYEENVVSRRVTSLPLKVKRA